MQACMYVSIYLFIKIYMVPLSRYLEVDLERLFGKIEKSRRLLRSIINLCVYVCMHVFVYVRAYVCVYVEMYNV